MWSGAAIEVLITGPKTSAAMLDSSPSIDHRRDFFCHRFVKASSSFGGKRLIKNDLTLQRHFCDKCLCEPFLYSAS